ncbi:MAG: type I restriction enzyme HsdR N-terminal domain-containing protein [Selenomonadaceae bacterium]|nr:type I restriction enzyme HsdR N-terminal domain-containing protein [Selenomonadaceae bacterium]
MKNFFLEYPAPQVYRVENQAAYFDPVRKKLVFVTPEETVRQCLIPWLLGEIGVPENFLRVEGKFSRYGLNVKTRADFIIEARDVKENSIYPVAVIVCKSPKIELDDNAFRQMFHYAADLGCEFCALTNGEKFFCYRFDGEKNLELDEFPTYAQMTCEKFLD